MPRRAPRRYVRDDEIRFRDQRPEPDQRIRVRLLGHKTYIPARWDAAAQTAYYLHCDGGTPVRWLQSWLPGDGS